MTDPAPEIPVPLPTNYATTQTGHVRHHNKLSYAFNTMVANRPVTLRDNPALDFTGTTDSAPALNAALADAGAGATVEMGRPGRLRLHSTITTHLHQTIIGGGAFPGAGPDPRSELHFPTLTGSQVGIMGGNSAIFKNMIIRGPATYNASTTGFKAEAGSSSPRFERVGFYQWDTGCSLTAAYYTVFDSCEWRRNRVGLALSGCYNLSLVTPGMYCGYGANDGSMGAGIVGGARGLNIFGGSIEGYGSDAAPAIRPGNVSTTNIFGTYFESNAGANAFGVNCAGLTALTVNMQGAMVFLIHHSRFMHLVGMTDAVVNSQGNKFVGGTDNPNLSTAYYIESNDLLNIKGQIGHDDWSEVAKGEYTPNGVRQMGPFSRLQIFDPRHTYMGTDLAGSGSPEGVVYGSVGAIYRRTDGSPSLYVKQSGNGSATGWVAK